MKVRCIATEHEGVRHDLSVGDVYEVIGIEAGDYRLLNDAGDPLLFSPEIFEVVDPTRPAHWVCEPIDGVEYAYSPELGAPGFFEDYHDGDPQAVRTFNRYLNRHLHLTDAA